MKLNRKAIVERKTEETWLKVYLDIDEAGESEINTGIKLFDHFLEQISVHGNFTLRIETLKADVDVDTHHLIEDTAIVIGQVFTEAIGSKIGIVRTAASKVPMDESLAEVIIDFSGRPFFKGQFNWQGYTIGSTNILKTSMVEHFLYSFAINAKLTLHSRVYYGNDNHHMAEALFKALGRALDKASRIDEKGSKTIPSSKGIL